MTDRHSTFHVTAAAKGERLDRLLAQNAELSRSRLKALILAGAVTIDGSTIRDPGHRVNAGDAITRRDPAGCARGAAAREHSAQHRARGRRADRDRQAEGAGGASGRRKSVRHAGQCADRALRREPFGHRRGEAPRHRAPAGQGYHRPDGGGEDRPRASQAFRPVRRPWPHRAAANGPIWPSSGARRTARKARSTRRSTATPRRATSRRCGRADARPSPIGSGWKPTPARTASRSRACFPAGWRPAGPTRSGCISPISAIRCSATTSMARASGPRRRCCRQPARAALEALGRQALHAYLLGFEHPVTGETVSFRAPLPADLAALRRALGSGASEAV